MKAKKTIWKVLIVDDQKEWVERYEEWLKYFAEKNKLSQKLDQEIKFAYDGENALQIIREDQEINIVISDMFMPPNCTDGYAPDDPKQPFGGNWLLKKIYEEHKERGIQCLLISDKEEAADYENKWLLTEPIPYKFVDKVPNIDSFKEQLWDKTFQAFSDILKISKVYYGGVSAGIVSQSAEMAKIMNEIREIHASTATILIQGESGTGKGLLAKYAHTESNRNNKTFVKIRCTEIPETLLESALFGHKKGAFTGAYKDRPGKLSIANNGTLFIDEVGELNPVGQTKILGALEEKEFYPVGGDESEKVDVRIIAATNKDLKEMVKKDLFRKDLFYRLNVIPFTLPPLRERKEDILLLADYFIDKFNKEDNRSFCLSREAREKMLSYDWPGNVRELENLMERAVATNNERKIIDAIKGEAQDDDFQPVLIPPEGIDLKEVEKANRMKLAKDALKQANGNRQEAAKLLKVSDRTFTRYLTGK